MDGYFCLGGKKKTHFNQLEKHKQALEQYFYRFQKLFLIS